MKSKKFDAQFDSGKTLIDSLDLAKARRVNREQRRVNVDFPVGMIESLDREATRVGVTLHFAAESARNLQICMLHRDAPCRRVARNYELSRDSPAALRSLGR